MPSREFDCYPRGRVREVLALFLQKDDAYVQQFQKALEVEAMADYVGSTPDVCLVCYQELYGYEDGTCVRCANTGICNSCIQILDFSRLENGIAEEYRWNKTLALWDESQMQEGDHVCLSCGLYCPSEIQTIVYRRFVEVCSCLDVLLDRQKGYALRQAAFAGWKIRLRHKEMLSLIGKERRCQKGIVVFLEVLKFLTFAEEVKLMSVSKHLELVRPCGLSPELQWPRSFGGEVRSFLPGEASAILIKINRSPACHFEVGGCFRRCQSFPDLSGRAWVR